MNFSRPRGPREARLKGLIWVRLSLRDVDPLDVFALALAEEHGLMAAMSRLLWRLEALDQGEEADP